MRKVSLNKGIVAIDGKKFFIDSEGNRQAGWKKVEIDWYYFSKEDGMKTGWLKDGGKWYHFSAAGVMQNGGLKKVTLGTT